MVLSDLACWCRVLIIVVSNQYLVSGVDYPPLVVEHPESKIIVQSLEKQHNSTTNHTIRCRGIGTAPMRYTWRKLHTNGTIDIRFDEVHGQNFDIPAPDYLKLVSGTVAHRTYYRCYAYNSYGQDMSSSAKVDFYYFKRKAQAVSASKTVVKDYFLNQPLQLECAADVESNPWPVYFWRRSSKLTHNGELIQEYDIDELTESNRISIKPDNGTLVFAYLTKDDDSNEAFGATYYSCFVMNPFIGKKQTVSGTSYVLRRLSRMSPGGNRPLERRMLYVSASQTVSAGAKLVLKCIFTGWPTTKVTWTTNASINAINNTNPSRSHVQIISEITRDHAGWYKCKGTHPFNNSVVVGAYVMQVLVLDPPVIQTSLPHFFVKPGTEAEFVCKGQENNSDSLPIWMMNANAIYGATKVAEEDGRLVTQNLKNKDVMTIQCLLSSDTGHVVKSATIIVLDPVDGGWSDYGEWSSCTATCGGGTMKATRTCTKPRAARRGTPCQGPSENVIDCNKQVCPRKPIDGGWSAYGPWTRCTATCNRGTQIRRRTCSNPHPSLNGSTCQGLAKENQTCNYQPCAGTRVQVSDTWGAFGAWTVCTKTCGSGVQTRSRLCSGQGCLGKDIVTRQCNRQNCPVDGTWGEFSVWSACSVTCGEGVRLKTRLCTNPPPKYGGQNCSGPSYLTESCNKPPCRVNGNWSPYSPWSKCSVTCGSGRRETTRVCNMPSPSNGGRLCFGPSKMYRNCSRPKCQTDGEWSTYTPWTACDVTCGNSTEKRWRRCVNPTSSAAVIGCVGESIQFRPCYIPCREIERKLTSSIAAPSYVSLVASTDNECAEVCRSSPMCVAAEWRSSPASCNMVFAGVVYSVVTDSCCTSFQKLDIYDPLTDIKVVENSSISTVNASTKYLSSAYACASLCSVTDDCAAAQWKITEKECTIATSSYNLSSAENFVSFVRTVKADREKTDLSTWTQWYTGKRCKFTCYNRGYSHVVANCSLLNNGLCEGERSVHHVCPEDDCFQAWCAVTLPGPDSHYTVAILDGDSIKGPKLNVTHGTNVAFKCIMGYEWPWTLTDATRSKLVKVCLFGHLEIPPSCSGETASVYFWLGIGFFVAVALAIMKTLIKFGITAFKRRHRQTSNSSDHSFHETSVVSDSGNVERLEENDEDEHGGDQYNADLVQKQTVVQSIVIESGRRSSATADNIEVFFDAVEDFKDKRPNSSAEADGPPPKTQEDIQNSSEGKSEEGNKEGQKDENKESIGFDLKQTSSKIVHFSENKYVVDIPLVGKGHSVVEARQMAHDKKHQEAAMHGKHNSRQRSHDNLHHKAGKK